MNNNSNNLSKFLSKHINVVPSRGIYRLVQRIYHYTYSEFSCKILWSTSP